MKESINSLRKNHASRENRPIRARTRARSHAYTGTRAASERASERRILRERRERLARREEVRARVRGWPLARVPARARLRARV